MRTPDRRRGSWDNLATVRIPRENFWGGTEGVKAGGES